MTASADIKNSQSGPIVLVGNGPSLNDFDMSKCAYPTMAMNGIAAYDQIKKGLWYPTYYVCISVVAMEDSYKKHIKVCVDHAKLSFLFINNVYSNQNSILLERDGGLNWHDDISESVGVFGTSAFACMQIIAYMGFTSVFMIGFDGGYKAAQDGKFIHYFSKDYPKSENIQYHLNDWDKVNEDQLKAKIFGCKKLNERGIKVFGVERLS